MGSNAEKRTTLSVVVPGADRGQHRQAAGAIAPNVTQVSPLSGVKRTSLACRSSVCLSACGDRPERLDPAVANADIPIVHVARRVAVPRHEPQLLIDL